MSQVIHASFQSHARSSRSASPDASKIGLLLFIGVVGVLFSLLLAAYVMRMNFADWRGLPEPWQLWLNTAMLIVSSLFLQNAQVAARRGWGETLKARLVMGGLLAVGFILGQLWVWQRLYELNYWVSSSPAISFFFLITGLHGLHLAGGLVALFRATRATWLGASPAKMASRVELCAIYWHFLLGLWMVLLGVMLFVTPSFVQWICGPG